jgi:ammonium transporter Rh
MFTGRNNFSGTITIHMFGAYFGMAVSYVFRSPKAWTLKNNKASNVSDILALIGTGLLWIYWPSFVGASVTGSPASENLCVLHTVLALLGSTAATFFFSQKLVGKFYPVHIANCTLAGGVAVGASARLDMTPGGALLLGMLAGSSSVFGFVHLSGRLESGLSIHDTCGVHNLHGMPSVLGGLASAIFVTMDSSASFLETSDKGKQALHQILAVMCTIAFSLVTGLITGFIMVKAVPDTPAEYDDAAWWESEYMVPCDSVDEDRSNRSRASVLPMVVLEEAANKTNG